MTKLDFQNRNFFENFLDQKKSKNILGKVDGNFKISNFEIFEISKFSIFHRLFLRFFSKLSIQKFSTKKVQKYFLKINFRHGKLIFFIQIFFLARYGRLLSFPHVQSGQKQSKLIENTKSLLFLNILDNIWEIQTQLSGRALKSSSRTCRHLGERFAVPRENPGLRGAYRKSVVITAAPGVGGSLGRRYKGKR